MNAYYGNNETTRAPAYQPRRFWAAEELILKGLPAFDRWTGRYPVRRLTACPTKLIESLVPRYAFELPLLNRRAGGRKLSHAHVDLRHGAALERA